MTEGVIEGGWEYVWLAYGITGGALLAYGLSLFGRLRAESRSAANANHE